MASTGLRLPTPRRRRRDLTSALALEARTTSSRLDWDAPATTISVAGLHGGAGATTLCLLLAHAVGSCASEPALTVDLAGRSRGGLAVHAGAASQASVEGTAAIAAIHGGRLEHPVAVTEAGVRVIGAYPDALEETERSYEALAARLLGGLRDDLGDARLGELARLAVAENEMSQALRWDNDEVATAVGRVLDTAIEHHALVAVDLGMADSSPLAGVVGARADVHAWVLPDLPHSLAIAERTLPELTVSPAGGEVIVVWHAGKRSSLPKRLSDLGDLRGCPVVRIANHGGQGEDWPARVLGSLSGVVALCELAR